MKSSEFVYLVKDYGCANFRNQQSFLTRLKFNTFKIEHDNDVKKFKTRLLIKQQVSKSILHFKKGI